MKDRFNVSAVEKVDKVDFIFQKIHSISTYLTIGYGGGGESGVFLHCTHMRTIHMYIYNYNSDFSPLSPLFLQLVDI